MPTIEELNQGFDLGDWQVLPAKGVLRREGEEIHPEPKVFAVLLALAQRDGNLVTRDELIDEVWGGKAFSDEPILRCISLLRGHIGDKKPFEYIGTLPRRGYRLLKRVRLHASTDSPSAVAPAVPRPGTGPWKIAAAVLAVGLLAVVALTWSLPGKNPDPRSLAIMPIDNLSGDPANQYIVEGIKYTLVDRLSSLPGFTIKNARVRYDMEPSDIAAKLDVQHVLFGSVQLEGPVVKVVYEIARGADNVTIGSGEITGDVDRLFPLHERLARAVRDELAGKRTPELITRRAPDSDAYNTYMRGVYFLEHRGDTNNLEAAIELFRESIRLDDRYGPAYLALATAYALLHDYRNVAVEESNRLAIETIERGVDKDHSIEDAAGSIYGFVYHQQKRWEESEEAHLRAINAAVVDSNAFNWYSRMLASVGRLDDALAQALAAERIDPDNAVINSRVAMAYTWLDRSEDAQEFFERANDLGATGTTHMLGFALHLFRTRQFEQAANLAEAGTRMAGVPGDWIGPVFAAFADPSQREPGLAAINDAAAAGILAPEVEVVTRTLLGDLDGAMEIARLLELPGEAFEMDLLFIPEMAPLRTHPDFLPLLERLGIVAYWEHAGCDWDGNSVSCGSA